MLTTPILKDFYITTYGFIGQLAFSTTLIFAILGLTKSIKWLIIGLLLVLTGFACNYLFIVSANPTWIYITLICDLSFLILSIVFATQQVISSESITLHNIFGAICIYILLSVIWSILYRLTYLLIPGSFSGINVVEQHSQVHDFLYFSFVTLTTLGYGDLLPLSATARTLAFVEAILGQFYIATMVAGLVAIHISNAAKDKT